eukprot:CAMPEP_0202900796 /NCGR_PEP_ID=MMETSP1392-20130828/12038_1 /ASSEMBLY_ACC=CAM_ASM_000868 /TAXON_ID=225041 /ORGANISM="Chlamydomonas chlamydogama, Strain SAG 11-48b" /LENGTH=143 /DNA_ID=CAMNT_0049587241 /DNA_START=77 /DNA_END=508 /DNA_ORIENTATION=+
MSSPSSPSMLGFQVHPALDELTTSPGRRPSYESLSQADLPLQRRKSLLSELLAQQHTEGVLPTSPPENAPIMSENTEDDSTDDEHSDTCHDSAFGAGRSQPVEIVRGREYHVKQKMIVQKLLEAHQHAEMRKALAYYMQLQQV